MDNLTVDTKLYLTNERAREVSDLRDALIET